MPMGDKHNLQWGGQRQQSSRGHRPSNDHCLHRWVEDCVYLPWALALAFITWPIIVLFLIYLKLWYCRDLHEGDVLCELASELWCWLGLKKRERQEQYMFTSGVRCCPCSGYLRIRLWRSSEIASCPVGDRTIPHTLLAGYFSAGHEINDTQALVT